MSPDLQVSAESSPSINPLIAAAPAVNRIRKQHPGDLQQVLLLVAELHRLGAFTE